MRDEVKETPSLIFIPHPSSLFLYCHDVVAAVYVNHFACDAGGKRAAKEESCIADFARLHVAAKRRALCVMLEHRRHVADGACRKRVDRPGADGVNPYVEFAQIVCKVA